MGLFDRFRKKITRVAEEADLETLSTPSDTEEAEEARKIKHNFLDQEPIPNSEEEDVEVFTQEKDDIDEIESEDEWDDWDDDEGDPTTHLTKKERKRLERQQRQLLKAEAKKIKKEEKKGLTSLPRLAGAKVDLHMMRSTTGRNLVSVESTPRGSTGTQKVSTEAADLSIDLGGGVVESGGRTIKQSKGLDDLLEELEWILLESDMSSDAVEAVIAALGKELVGSQLRKGAKLSKVVEASLKRTLRALLVADYWDFDATVEQYINQKDTPVIILLCGVNGTGKTTTAAKIGHRMKQKGHHVVAAAADTFRAGAIEQLESHMERLEIKCISSQRGGDSAAISRDAINHAKAKGADIVLIDTAGRMQNKTNLMNELQKVHRVTQPHLVLFVGDALAGNDAVEQAIEFQKIMSFDGVVLTKIDTDAKGGCGLSIAYASGKPIVLVGVGQEYEDLNQFDPDWLLKQLFE